MPHKVSVVTDFSNDLPLIRCDRVQLQQVLINLIQDATDARRARRLNTRYNSARPAMSWLRDSIARLKHGPIAAGHH
jgi:C4-dicarboxylate-specific signal transduction histidine kinase